ncbi:LacI family DNA-binding transcriptional regulator [Priestia taiwanensis]|uniref:LacI family transcriptional regulator n=1 Tax=Priestia taiwanensis TaxID=1347902 RepID=A0A917AT40_9BACI|nr:LacI family DNA-binding transcriptional regulator [Priestia taiwanensis]MBM7364288.1 DNA-binding LacI/PurR family transcriptional regulator [Priestia taiwanensis]GGE73227.1 LacI family transcriptional regulator [Priestia taiwanensis]
MANIKEIAKLAGVSITTVSRVLNNHPYVSEEKRKIVHEVIEKMGYARNVNAVHLVKGKTNIIGVILPYIDHPWFAGLIEGIMQEAHTYNYRILLCPTNYEKEEEISILEMLKHKQIDGLIICSKANTWDHVTEYARYGPIVACEKSNQHEISSTYINSYAASATGIDYLIEQGHRHIGIVVARINSFNNSQRFEAYKEAHLRLQEQLREEWIFTNYVTMNDGIELVHKWMKMGERPTALLVAGDTVAAGIVTEARKNSIYIPNELAIIGLDNQPIAEALDITTIAQPIHEVGMHALNIIHHKLTGDCNEIRDIELPYELIKRKTV